MSDVEKTPEELAALAELAAAKKLEDKRLADDAKLSAKAAKEVEKLAAKEAKAAEKAAEKAAKDAAKEEAKLAKEAEKAAKLEANKMPVSNGVTRPKPDSLCGKAWAVFDAVSQETGAPATIAASLEKSTLLGLNEGNVRAEYARWRKFFGISGRLLDPAKEAEKALAAQAKADEKAAKEAKKLEDKRLKDEAKALKALEEKAAKEAKRLEEAGNSAE